MAASGLGLLQREAAAADTLGTGMIGERDDAHVAAFYEAVRTGSKPPADIEIGASGALTAILGREAIYKNTVTKWADFHIDI